MYHGHPWPILEGYLHGAIPIITIDCFVRASALVDPVDAPIEQLRTYETQGVIDDLDVRAWPDEVPLADPTDDAVIARYDLFQMWADDNDFYLEPGFTIRNRTTLVSDEPESVLVLPVVCLAIHIDGELTSVVPHCTGTATYTVDEALAELDPPDRALPMRPGAASAPTDSARPSAPTRTPGKCPECGDRLITGQGLYACLTCSWTTSDSAEISSESDTRTDESEPSTDADTPEESGAPDADKNGLQLEP